MHAVICTAFGAGLMAFVGLALAHPSLLNSVPKSGDALDTPPKEIRLKFNDPIEVTFTHVKVVDASGKELPVEAPQRDPSDTGAAIVPLPLLRAGSYKASWSVVGRDRHRVKGELSFSVK